MSDLWSSNIVLRILTGLVFVPLIYFLSKGGLLSMLICLGIGTMVVYEGVVIASAHDSRFFSKIVRDICRAPADRKSVV